MSDRAAGILLHPTSLPGPYGVGDLGPEAHRFVDWAVRAGQSLWQMLPVGPAGGHNSPYGCLSAFAGSPLLISPDFLVEDGWLDAAALDGRPAFAEDRADFQAVMPWKRDLLKGAWERFKAHGTPAQRDSVAAFEESPLQRDWLSDWALFAALVKKYEGTAWPTWERGLAKREPAALASAARELDDETGYQRFLQHLFFAQWERLRAAANERGLQLFGDLPIYTAFNSADVWANQDLFDLDATGWPNTVAGVPPDAFSDTGQRWGNPLYDWDRMEQQGFRWWVARIGMAFRLADVVRIDHFRGFAAFWEVPAEHKTALHGLWVPGPGRKLFDAIRATYGDLPIVAEDLGVITPDVKRLLDETGFPGMKILQFAFGEHDSEYLPHRHVANSVVFTGTHDNDTSAGWFASLGEEERTRVLDYIGVDGSRIAWDLIRTAYASVSRRAVVPFQDVLGLGSQARMNLPGRAEMNWEWRAPADAFTDERAKGLYRLAELTGRVEVPKSEAAAATAAPAPDLLDPEGPEETA